MMTFPIYGKIKYVPNHRSPTSIAIRSMKASKFGTAPSILKELYDFVDILL